MKTGARQEIKPQVYNKGLDKRYKKWYCINIIRISKGLEALRNEVSSKRCGDKPPESRGPEVALMLISIHPFSPLLYYL
jgi:hypothetical protein